MKLGGGVAAWMSKFIDYEAVNSDGDSSDDEDGSEDGSSSLDGFIVDDDEVEEPAPKERKRKKHGKRRLEDEELDEGDLLIVNEAKQALRKAGLARCRRIVDSEEEACSSSEHEEPPPKPKKKRRTPPPTPPLVQTTPRVVPPAPPVPVRPPSKYDSIAPSLFTMPSRNRYTPIQRDSVADDKTRWGFMRRGKPTR